jgi:Uma2 family endonuclease
MTAAKRFDLVSVYDYLAGELASPNKHEYVGGVVYAMAGARYRHNQIASNLLVALGSRLRGKRCRVLNSDSKVRIRLPNQVRFYYPDVSVDCRPNSPDDYYYDEPTLVAEVLSPSTRRIDEGEKKDAYLMIPALTVYMLVEQERARVVVHRRTDHGFVREVYEEKDVIPLPEVASELPLGEIYEGVEFRPQPEEEAD